MKTIRMCKQIGNLSKMSLAIIKVIKNNQSKKKKKKRMIKQPRISSISKESILVTKVRSSMMMKLEHILDTMIFVSA